VGTDRAFGEAMTIHSLPGMIFVFADLPLDPDQWTGRDFDMMS
jgi:hypothetical protein